jgi:hypothetical protein
VLQDVPESFEYSAFWVGMPVVVPSSVVGVLGARDRTADFEGHEARTFVEAVSGRGRCHREGRRIQITLPAPRRNRLGLNRPCGLLERPVAARTRAVNRGGDIGARETRELRHKISARLIGGDIAAIEQEIALIGQAVTQRSELALE